VIKKIKNVQGKKALDLDERGDYKVIGCVQMMITYRKERGEYDEIENEFCISENE
jgi:hypothetical protein